MFIRVNALTQSIDETIKFYYEGKASKDNHSKEEYDNWYDYIISRLSGKLSKLKEISYNRKLIEKYETKINRIIQEGR